MKIGELFDKINYFFIDLSDELLEVEVWKFVIFFAISIFSICIYLHYQDKEDSEENHY